MFEVLDALDGGSESFCRRNRSNSQGVHWNRHENAKEFEILNLPFMWLYFNKVSAARAFIVGLNL
jgi:hypothetical protein